MATTRKAPGLEASTSSLTSLDNDNSVPSSANLDTQNSKWTSASTSLTASPAQSRDASPSRATVAAKSARPTRTPTPSIQSRKNGGQETSPVRTRSTVTPAPTTPRQQLSAGNTPSLPPPSSNEPALRAPVPKKPSTVQDASKDSPRWPISPRLKSPPPNFGRPTAASSARKNDPEPPIINVQRSTPSPHVEPVLQPASDNEVEDHHLSSGIRTPGRGPSSGSSMLETVQEVSQPNTPRPGLSAAIEKLEETAATQRSGSNKDNDTSTTSSVQASQSTTNSESGSDSGSAKPKTRRTSAAAPPPLLASRQSSTALKFTGRGQPSGESSSRNMTVETEEVKNMPQLSLNPDIGRQAINGSLRARPSSETIKPRKEKKKQTRKTSTVPSGNASSKADIFEAKVASAVEEANSSDSDETFVYDSNPPDAERPRRYHSRTPSATSMASQLDRSGLRSIHAVMENGAYNHANATKKNMKFSNTYTSNGNESTQGDDDGRGTARSAMGSGRGTARHHHHVGRWGRNNGNGLPSLFDNESPFPSARNKFSNSNLRQPSNPPSPRFNVNPSRNWLSGAKRQIAISNGYDMDDATTGADDERTPLLLPGSVRSARSNRARRNAPLRDIESRAYRQNPSFLNRFASCLVLTVMLLLVITGAIGFMFATSQPLTDVELLKIGNVLASEQELMFDLSVEAHNPNVVVVMIDSADIEVFAKSPHAGNDSEWWRNPHGDDSFITNDSENEDDSPDEESSPNMRLGNIVSFDSPLTYEGTFFQSGLATSSGELRLPRPGNTTDSGTQRWERILADEFTLIIKGVLKYTLPLSQKVRKVPISGRTVVKPNSANDPTLRPNGYDLAFWKPLAFDLVLSHWALRKCAGLVSQAGAI
ncbi:hypothetical protein F5Y18DRAFT_414056 [Xylariaceae sp. FL1019]|nr:hypothetical protein F5Y18DRAFT_414056 [Xylariaceae sp. FL1019]